jgi:hypothetical protein
MIANNISYIEPKSSQTQLNNMQNYSMMVPKTNNANISMDQYSENAALVQKAESKNYKWK